MRRRPARFGISALAAIVVLGLTVAPIAADSHIKVVASGLDNPRGIDVGRNGVVVFAETGAGKLHQIRRGVVRTLAKNLPVASFEGEVTGVVGVSLTGSGNVYTSVGEGLELGAPWSTLWRVTPKGKAKQVANIGAFQATNPDPDENDVPADPTQSNPYGIESIGSGRVLVTDAGNNDLVLVRPGRKPVQVARFPTRDVSGTHVGIPVPVTAEAVPTTVARGPDGYWYVGQLLGFPFTPGESMIWRIAPWARNAVCDSDTSDGCAPYMSGFSSVVGIEFGRDGSLYVLEMVKSGLAACFGPTGDCGGALWRVKGGVRTEIAPGSLVTPGDVAVARNGSIWVTNMAIQAGQGQVLRIRP
jgi:hypothetical protein